MADLVGPGEKHDLRERIDIEFDHRAVGHAAMLLDEVDGQDGVRVRLQEFEQPAMGHWVDDDREEPIRE